MTCGGCWRSYPLRPHLDLLAPVRRPPNEGPGDTAAMAQRRRRWEERALRRDCGERLALERYLDSVAPHVRRDATVLDLGCGTGAVLQALGRRVAGPLLLLGLDISKPMLDTAYRALRREPRAVLLRASSRRRLPFRDQSVDVVMRRLAPSLLDEVVRVLAPGGAFVAASFGSTHWSELYDLLPELPRPRPARHTGLDHLLSAGFARAEYHSWRGVERIPAAEALERVLLGPAGFHVDRERDLPRLATRTGDSAELFLTTDVDVLVGIKGAAIPAP